MTCRIDILHFSRKQLPLMLSLGIPGKSTPGNRFSVTGMLLSDFRDVFIL